MAELWEWMTETPEGTHLLGALAVGAVGLMLYVINWVIFIQNLIPGRKWVSMVPPLGGLLIAIALLMAGCGWWALLGLTDPAILSFAYALFEEFVIGRKKPPKE